METSAFLFSLLLLFFSRACVAFSVCGLTIERERNGLFLQFLGKKIEKKGKNLQKRSLSALKNLRAQAISLVDITTAEKKERNNKHAIRNVEF